MLFITGATGTVGSRVIQTLKLKDVTFKALTRTPEKLLADRTDQMIVVTGDIKDCSGWSDSLRGVETLFLILLDDAEEILQAARDQGIRNIVFLSSASINRSDAGYNENAMKHKKVEEQIQAYGFQYVFIRAEAFMHNTVYWRDLFRYNKGTIRLPALEAKLASVHEADIAEVISVVVTDFDRFSGKVLTLTGANILSQRNILSEISKQLGQSIQLEEQTIDDFRSYMGNYIAEEYITLRVQDWEYSLKHKLAVTDTVLMILGREPYTFREWIAEHIRDFQ
ncbi:NmrA family NAD(P)-binding protein [Paenibacillus sp. FSL K6-1217]|uniref:NmrA family NAD(P)-binding protein n=1 Tax=Paenibacillus sp. FSL K6-1217 TaxID=2921466 RepID=UPI0032538ECC